jgi:hypothetical protein
VAAEVANNFNGVNVMAEITWEASVDAAVAKAKQEGKLALVDFSAAPA